MKNHSRTFSRSARRKWERLLFLAALAGLSGPAIAQQDDEEPELGDDREMAVNIVGGVGVVTNPYNELNAPDTSVFANLEIRPVARQSDETTSFELQGLVQLRQFAKRYGLEDNYALNGSMVSRRSDRLTVRAAGGFAYSESGYGNNLTSTLPANSIDPVPPVLPLPGSGAPFDDVTLLGQRTRTTSIDSRLGLDYRFTDRSILSADVSGRAMRFKDSAFGDYYSFSEELRYSHILSDRTTVGAIAQFSQTDYRRTSVGDANTISGLLSLDHRFNERWRTSVSGGLAVTDIKQLPGQGEVTVKAFTMRGSLCRDGERSSLCINAYRSPQPSANGSVRTSQSFGADYSYRLSARERFNISAAYTDASRARLSAINVPKVEYVSGSARYENDIRRNMTVFASAGYSKIYETGTSRRANYEAMVGLRFRLGASR